jgi:hypothetical protein
MVRLSLSERNVTLPTNKATVPVDSFTEAGNAAAALARASATSGTPLVQRLSAPSAVRSSQATSAVQPSPGGGVSSNASP